MQYMLLVYDTPGAWPTLTDEEMGEVYSEYAAVSQNTATKHSAQLKGTEEAKTVRVKDGQTLVTDGPFAETKEAARRVLPRRGRLDRRGDEARRADPVRALRRLRGGPADRGDVAVQYMLLIYGTTDVWECADRRRACARSCEGYGRLGDDLRARRKADPRRRAAARRARRRACGCGTTRRSSPTGPSRRRRTSSAASTYRGRDARRGDRLGLANPSTRRAAPSRCGRSSTTRGRANRRPRPCLPRRACALHRDPRPRPRRSRPRRGCGAGRVRPGR